MLNLPSGNTMLGNNAYDRLDAIMSISELPGACVAQQQDSRRERHGEAYMHLNLPDGNTMLGSECGGYQMMTATDEQIQLYLPVFTE